MKMMWLRLLLIIAFKAPTGWEGEELPAVMIFEMVDCYLGCFELGPGQAREVRPDAGVIVSFFAFFCLVVFPPKSFHGIGGKFFFNFDPGSVLGVNVGGDIVVGVPVEDFDILKLLHIFEETQQTSCLGFWLLHRERKNENY